MKLQDKERGEKTECVCERERGESDSASDYVEIILREPRFTSTVNQTRPLGEFRPRGY